MGDAREIAARLAARWRLRRFAMARQLIHAGLKVMPDGPAKRELTEVIRDWGDKVRLVVSVRAELMKDAE